MSSGHPFADIDHEALMAQVSAKVDAEIAAHGGDPVAALIDRLGQVTSAAFGERRQRVTTTRRFGSQPERAGLAQLVMSADEIADDPARWLAERRQSIEGQWRVTASEMAAVLGLAAPANGSAFSLYYAKTAGVSIFDGSDRTDVGHALEDLTADKFAAANPDLIVGPGGLFVSTVYPWLAATFDRIVWCETYPCACPGLPQQHDAACTVRDGGLLPLLVPVGSAQCKTWANRPDFGPAGSAVMPVQIRVQVLVEMIVLGTDRAYVPVMWLPSGQVTTFVIERNPDVDRDIEAILKGGAEFVACLDEEQPPEPDWTPATTKTMRRMFPQIKAGKQVRIPIALAFRYKRARAAAERAKERLGKARNEIQFRMGDAEDAYASDPLTGTDRVVCTRQGGPVAGYSVPPKEWREQMRAGDWGAPE